MKQNNLPFDQKKSNGESVDISYKVDPDKIEAAKEEFAALTLSDQQRFLMELLDKNLLYVNYCDIDDEDFSISEEDKKFSRSFYGEGGKCFCTKNLTPCANTEIFRS